MPNNNVFPFSAAAFSGGTAQAPGQVQTTTHPCPRPECDAVFTSAADLRQHQYRKSHWRCVKCELDFWDGTSLKKHNAQRHLPEIELVCPGCESTFGRPSTLMKHIESDQCRVIKPGMINDARKRRVDFVKGLGSMNPANDNNLFCDMDENDVNADIRPWFQPDRLVRNFVEMEDDDAFLSVRQPETPTPKQEYDAWLKGDTKEPDLLTGDNLAALNQALEEEVMEKDAGPWASKENQVFLNIRPTPKQLFGDLELEHNDMPVDVSKRVDGRVVDPDKEGYHPGVFYEPLFEKYKCPHLRCGKKFERPGGLTSHLKSPVHKAGMRIQCPYCKRLFATMTDAIAHAESATQKCQIRESDLFREFMANVSGGLIDAFLTKPERFAYNVPHYVVPLNILAELAPGLQPNKARGVATPIQERAEDDCGVSPVSTTRQSSVGNQEGYW